VYAYKIENVQVTKSAHVLLHSAELWRMTAISNTSRPTCFYTEIHFIYIY